MTQRRQAYRTVARGMTLIEMTVALVLLSLLSAGILTSFRIGERTWHQLSAATANDRELLTAQRFLRQVIESAYPFQPSREARFPTFGLEGTDTELAVTAPMPQGAGSGGHYRYVLAVEESARGSKSLVVRWSLDRNGASTDLQQPAAADAHHEVLIEGLQSLEWAYLDPVDLGSDDSVRRWRTQWKEHRNLPAVVRLRVSFAPADTRRWPELIIAPRITDDARCQFDVVSQSCRESSG